VGTAALGCPAGEARSRCADSTTGDPMSARSSIWLGKSNGKHLHIYWELAERESDENALRAPVYIAADAEDTGEEIAIRLPKEIAMKLLMVPSPSWTEDVYRVL
jgi:hypothetical protein